MKLTSTILWTSVLLLVASPASAQVVIPAEARPSTVGTSWQMYRNASSGVAVDVGSAGPSQRWDLRDGPEEVISTTTVVALEETPFAIQVLGKADGAWVETEISEAETLKTEYTYFRRTSSETVLIAVVTEGSWFILFEPGLAVLTFPLVFGHRWSSQSMYTRSTLGGYVASIVRSWILYDLVVDGWGTVEVPAGEYACLRLRRSARYNIPGRGEQSGIRYQWIAPGIGTVASVLSLPGEENLEFTRAFTVSRLRSIRLATDVAPERWGRIKHLHR